MYNMEIYDKLIKPIREVNYLRAENVDHYRIIIKYFCSWIWKNQLYREFQLELLTQFPGTKAVIWLQDYFEVDKSANRYYELDAINYKKVIEAVCDAMNNLPIDYHKYESMPVFAQKITKNPHYVNKNWPFDLLLKGIKWLLKIDDDQYEHISQILYQVGIIKDELSNYYYICHIKPEEDKYRINM